MRVVGRVLAHMCEFQESNGGVAASSTYGTSHQVGTHGIGKGTFAHALSTRLPSCAPRSAYRVATETFAPDSSPRHSLLYAQPASHPKPHGLGWVNYLYASLLTTSTCRLRLSSYRPTHPRPQDFSEDTYRTLAAADNAVLLVDGAKGIEPQTRKLFAVARLRGLPVFTFVNKMDRWGATGGRGRGRGRARGGCLRSKAVGRGIALSCQASSVPVVLVPCCWRGPLPPRCRFTALLANAPRGPPRLQANTLLLLLPHPAVLLQCSLLTCAHACCVAGPR